MLNCWFLLCYQSLCYCSKLSSYSVLLTELTSSAIKTLFHHYETLEGIDLFSHMLEILNINNCFNHDYLFLFFDSSMFHTPEQSPHSVTDKGGKLSSEATSSLTLQSLHFSTLQTQTFSVMTALFVLTDHTYQFSSLQLQWR